MRRQLLTLILATLVPAVAFGQSNGGHRGQGYVYFAPGVATSDGESVGALHIGGGGEGFFTRNLGVGADLGYQTETGRCCGGVGTFSPNVVTRFPSKNSESKVEPFFTGGYTLFHFFPHTANGFNFGGGLNYWFKERIGLRFEVRDNVMVIASGGQSHFVGFRIGLAFR